jgi:hypothetical protein
MERFQRNQADAGASSKNYARKIFELPMGCERVHFQSALPVFFALHLAQPERISQPIGQSFHRGIMMH